MNFIKKYFLKKKLKKAIDSIGVITPYMCNALFYISGINKHKIPEFNYDSFKEFIELYYPELACYMHPKSQTYEYSIGWMTIDSEEIFKAKRHFLTNIMNSL